MRGFYLAVNVAPEDEAGIINPGNKRMTAGCVVELLNALTREVNYLRVAVHQSRARHEDAARYEALKRNEAASAAAFHSLAGHPDTSPIGLDYAAWLDHELDKEIDRHRVVEQAEHLNEN